MTGSRNLCILNHMYIDYDIIQPMKRPRKFKYKKIPVLCIRVLVIYSGCGRLV